MELLQSPYNLQGKNVQGTRRACGGIPPSIE
jgi:hypothetical protein